MNTTTLPTNKGPATVEELQELHRLVVTGLCRHLKATDSAAVLGVARAMLRDQGLLGLARAPHEQKRLQRLYGLLVSRLLDAMQQPGGPSAAVLGEVRQLLAAEGIHKDLEGSINQERALKALGDADLPFATNTKH
jgi:hypothetical protein